MKIPYLGLGVGLAFATPSVIKTKLWWDGNIAQATTHLLSPAQLQGQWNLNLVNPGVGSHQLHVQIQGENGVWGPEQWVPVYVDAQLPLAHSLPKLSALKLWWDSDSNHAQTVMAPSPALALATWAQNQSTLSAGSHRLNLQAMGADGKYGTVFRSSVYVESNTPLSVQNLPQVQAVRAYWNQDSAHAQTWIKSVASPLDLRTQNLNSPRAGTQQLNIQIQGSDHSWGPAYRSVIYVDPDIPLTRALPVLSQLRYWWNQDSSSAVLVPRPLHTALDLSNLSLQAPSAGYQKLHVQAMNEGLWGPVLTAGIWVDPQLPLSLPMMGLQSIKAWWDSDSLNAQVLAAGQGQLSKALGAWTQNLGALSSGNHRLQIQAQNLDGSWGPVYKSVLRVDTANPHLSFEALRIQKGEVYCGSDPGIGRATAMNVVSQGALALSQLQLPANLLKTGSNSCALRVQNGASIWGSDYRFVVQKEGNQTPILDSVSGVRGYCATAGNHLQSYQVMSSKPEGARWLWSVQGGDLLAQSSNMAQIRWDSTLASVNFKVWGENSVGSSDTLNLTVRRDTVVAAEIVRIGDQLQSRYQVPGLSYTWEKWNGSSWGALSSSQAQLNLNSTGQYRLSVQNGVCPAQVSTSLNVVAVNHAPVSHDSTVLVPVQNSMRLDLRTLALDADGDALNYTAIAWKSISGRTVQLNQAELQWQSDSTWSGLDTLSVQISDGRGGLDTLKLYVQDDHSVKLSQSLQFTSLSSDTISKVLNLSGSASSGLDLSFSSLTPAVCTVSVDRINLIGAGACTVRASQPGDDRYRAAASVEQTLTVYKRSQRLQFSSLASDTIGKIQDLGAMASSGLSVGYMSVTPAICTVSAARVNLIGAGTCRVQAMQLGDDQFAPSDTLDQTMTVYKRSQSLQFGTLGHDTISRVLALSAQATSGLNVSYHSATPTVCTVNGNQLSLVGAGLCTVQASQLGDDQYDAAVALSQSLTVYKRSQTLQFGPMNSVDLMQGIVVLQGNSNSGLRLGYRSTNSAVCTVSSDTVYLHAYGQCPIEASQGGDAVWLPSSLSQSFAIRPGIVAISDPFLRNYAGPCKVVSAKGQVVWQGVVHVHQIPGILQSLPSAPYWLEGEFGRVQVQVP